MIVIYFLIIVTFTSAESVENSTEHKLLLLNEKNWKIFVEHKDENFKEFFFDCNDCSQVKDWTGLKIFVEVFPDIKQMFFDVRFSNEGMQLRFYKNSFKIYAKHSVNKNLYTANNTFSIHCGCIFSNPVHPVTDKVIERFYVNDELIFGKPRDKEKEKQPTQIELPVIRRACHIYVNSLNYEVPKSEATILVNYLPSFSSQGLFLSLIVQDTLQDIRSSDFKVVNNGHNQWTLSDFGYRILANEAIQVNLTLVANDLILDPIPLSIILNDYILCGFYPRSHFSSCIFNSPFRPIENKTKVSKEETTRTLYQNKVMLLLIIALITIFGIYAIVATFQWITLRRHYNQMTLDLWNKILSDSKFDNFPPEEYDNAVL